MNQLTRFFTIFAIVCSIFVVVITHAETVQPEPEHIPITNGEYQIKNSLMVVDVDYPMTTDRLAVYGNIIRDKKGQQVVNFEDEKKLTEDGREIYQRLMSIQTNHGMSMLFSVTITHAQISILKYRRIPWEEVIPEVDKILATLSDTPKKDGK